MKPPPLIKAVLFDFDGTLTRPGLIDFRQIREEIGCPADRPILEYISDIQDPEAREKFERILFGHEDRAAEASMPNKGAEAVLQFLRSRGIPFGIITRNRLSSVVRALENFSRFRPEDFSVIVTRESAGRPKPHPDGLLLAAEQMGRETKSILMVGDFVFDVQAGNRAGAPTAFLSNETAMLPENVDCDVVAETLSDLISFLQKAIPLPNGKVPNDLLAEILGEQIISDESVLVGPGIGEDAAAVDVTGESVALLKSDPITFATESIGHYTILVNANDIATMGGTPRWMLTTLLFPSGTSGFQIGAVVEQMASVCRRWDIVLCGGHTEITDAVTRTVAVGMMVGTITRSDLIEKQNMAPGDRILMTKGAGVEGTAIIALEFSDTLKTGGMTDTAIDRCRAFLDHISILPEAQIAAACPGVTAMHDVTEGGIATALRELSHAGNCRIEIDIDRIPVFPETAHACQIVGLDPMGLIGSGSLLIACRETDFQQLVNTLQNAGIICSLIGEATGEGSGIDATAKGQPADWPEFAADEITRLFS